VILSFCKSFEGLKIRFLNQSKVVIIVVRV